MSMLVLQESTAALGAVMDPITASGPPTVPNEDVLTQWLGGALETDSYLSRGGDLSAPISGTPNYATVTELTGDSAANSEAGRR